jgi:hypothetical protein
VVVAALGIDADGRDHRLTLVEGSTENAAVVRALIDNLIERRRDPKVCRLFIVDGAKAPSKVIRRPSGPHADPAVPDPSGSQRDRAPAKVAARVSRSSAAQAWDLYDADKAERLLRNLGRRLDREAPIRHPTS